MTPVGFEPTQLALVELESTPLDHSGKVSMRTALPRSWPRCLLRGRRPTGGALREVSALRAWISARLPANILHLPAQDNFFPWASRICELADGAPGASLQDGAMDL